MSKKKSEKLKVRVTKSKQKKKPEKNFIPQKKKNKSKKGNNQKKERNKLILIVGVVMLIIFIFWLSFLGRNLERVENRGTSFLGGVVDDLKNEFSQIKEKFNEARSSISENSNQSQEDQIEKNIFPETK